MLEGYIKMGISISGKEALGARDAWSCLATSSSSPTSSWMQLHSSAHKGDGRRGTRLGRKDGEGAAGSPWQSTRPAHAVRARSNSALAWRRAPRARPDLNVLFVRLALGRSSPSASVWLACTRAIPPAHCCSVSRAPMTCSPHRERMFACNSRRTCKLVCSTRARMNIQPVCRAHKGCAQHAIFTQTHACSV